jgi:acetyltransferase-like isoleucine patch superfamily enzyme
MKTGLGLFRKLRVVYANINLFRFWWRKTFLGFDVANQFVQRVDKISLKLILSRNGATIGQNCDIETGLVFHNCKNYKNLIIGNNCHIGKNCFFDLREKVVIGNNVVISMQCTFITHIDMNKSPLKEKYPAHEAPISIGANCYLGTNTIVLKGVTLGKSVFSAAGSVIIRAIDDHCLIGGVPAKVIKKHFE